MEAHRKTFSGNGSQMTGEEYSVISPNRSNYSGKSHTAMPPTFPGHAKIDQYNENHQYFPNIVEDLLSGKEEWRNIQDIIKMTLKALCGVIKDQGLAITELEKTMYMKANKSELNRALDTKANITDVSQAITEVASQLEERASLEEVNAMTEDKVSKSDLQYLLTNKVSIEELRTLLENKSNVHEVNQNIQAIDSKLERYFDDIKSNHKNFALQRDLCSLKVQLELKADLSEVNENLSNKANKTTVANALHRKANKGETEDTFKLKLDKKELGEILESHKKDVLDSYTLAISKEKEKLVKIDHFRELEDIIMRKAEKAEIDMYLSAVNTQKKDFERRVQVIERDTADILRTVQTEIETIRVSCIENLGRKVDADEFDRLNQDVHTKLDSDAVMTMLNQTKSDLYISINEVKDELLCNRKKYEESLYERASRAEVNSERTAEDLQNFKTQVKDLKKTIENVEMDSVEYTKSMFNSTMAELKKDIDTLDSDYSTFKTEIVHRVDNSLLTDEFDKFKTLTTQELKEKVDVGEVQRAITGCQNDTINRIIAAKKEMNETVDELSKFVTSSLSQKVGLQDLDSRLTYYVGKEQFEREMDNSSSRKDTQEIADQIRELYSLVDQKADYREF